MLRFANFSRDPYQAIKEAFAGYSGAVYHVFALSRGYSVGGLRAGRRRLRCWGRRRRRCVLSWLKRLKKAPRILAQEIANTYASEGGRSSSAFRWLEPSISTHILIAVLSGTNWLVVRGEWRVRGFNRLRRCSGVLVRSNTSINPNKAAHIGARASNAALLGDSGVGAWLCGYWGTRCRSGEWRLTIPECRWRTWRSGCYGWRSAPPVSVKRRWRWMRQWFDYECWVIYAKATQFFAADKVNAARMRGETLRAIEEGRGEEAEVAEVVADAIVSFHFANDVRLQGCTTCWRAKARFYIEVLGCGV